MKKAEENFQIIKPMLIMGRDILKPNSTMLMDNLIEFITNHEVFKNNLKLDF